jgi:ribosomal protein L15
MQLHELKAENRTSNKKRIGRGGKRGTYSGKGMKGQKSRAGRKIRPSIRDLIQRTPKLRGAKDKAGRHRSTRKSKSYNKSNTKKDA